MALEQIDGIPLTAAQAREIDRLAKSLREEMAAISEADSVEMAEAVFLCSHTVDTGPTGLVWSALSIDGDPDEVAFAEEVRR